MESFWGSDSGWPDLLNLWHPEVYLQCTFEIKPVSRHISAEQCLLIPYIRDIIIIKLENKLFIFVLQ